MTKSYRPVSLLTAVSKFSEKLNNRLVYHLETCDLFPDFQYGFRYSPSAAYLLTVVSDRIARAFNRPGVTRAAALDISKIFDRVWHAGLLHKLNVLWNFVSDSWPYFIFSRYQTTSSCSEWEVFKRISC